MTIKSCSVGYPSGAMAKGGDVFVLDMGKPVKIYDLAKKMVQVWGKIKGCKIRRCRDIDHRIEARRKTL